MNRRVLILWGFLGFVGILMLAGVIAVLFPRWRMSGEMLASTALIGGYSLAGMILYLFGKRMIWSRRLFFASLAVSLIAFLIVIWFEQSMRWRVENYFWVTGAAAITLAGGILHRVFVWPIRVNIPSGTVLRWIAIIFSVTTTVFIMTGFIADGFRWSRGYGQFVGLNVIGVAGSTVALGAMALFGPKPGDDEPGMLAASIPVSMTCPRCQSIVEAHSSKETRCQSCRLKIHVEVEEPRCSCGYLLYELQSDTCPECGVAIASEDRWQKA